MSSAWNKFWNALPPVVRTIVHVALGAALAYAVAQGAAVLSGDTFDPNIFVAGLMTAIGTAVAKFLNPADPAYGVGASGSSSSAAAAAFPTPVDIPGPSADATQTTPNQDGAA